MMLQRTLSKHTGFLILLFCGSVVVPVQARSVRIDLGTLAPKNSSFHRILLAMGQEWRKAPGGGVRLKVYPSGVVGTESDMVREMRVGGIQAALLSTAGLSDIDYDVGNFQSLPMMFRNLEEFTFVYQRMQPVLEKRLEAKGFKVLFWTDAGWVYFFSKDKLMTPADLKQRKIFAAANITETADLWRKYGYHPVSIDVSDIPMGLQTGMIDTVSVPPVFAMATRIDKTAKHMLDLKWAPLFAAAVIQKRAWDKLPAATQSFIKTSAQKAAAEMTQRGRDESAESIAAMQKRGLQVNHASPEIVKQWVRSTHDMYETLRGGLVPVDIFDQVQRLLTEYRATQ